ncbi:hypothetical protein CYJ66_01990 [Gardnerella vaginalis]|nr:hypothetical protein CYJ66_01990 [Gardnerella vaginalis]PKZ55669.1 hypothetical protein CYJ64_01990 [Gardnerella vaginalis]PMC49500.1 hypothetical protein CJ212_01650 [Gardnerella vaginalis]
MVLLFVVLLFVTLHSLYTPFIYITQEKSQLYQTKNLRHATFEKI